MEEECSLAEEELPYAGYLACAEYSNNSSNCSSEGDEISNLPGREVRPRVLPRSNQEELQNLDTPGGSQQARQTRTRLPKDEDKERVDADMELALALAIDLMEGRLSRRQAENRMAEE